MVSRSGNPHLALWIAATGLSHGEIARRIAAVAKARGHRQIAPDATRIRRWIDGEKPRPPVPVLLAEVLSEAVGQPLTPGDLGLTGTGVVLDSIQLPLLTEAAAQALAGWTQMDLFMNRRDTLKLALGAPLILAAEQMLGGTARALNHETKGFDADTVSALEEVTAFFSRADASKAAACTGRRSSPNSRRSPAASRTASRHPSARGSSRRPPTWRHWPGGSATTAAGIRRPSGTGATARTRRARPDSRTAEWRSSPACRTR
ncbi:hypothetical protein ABZS86_22490 [Streptomyces sp. NPDC005355]|uniref:hypothetical protein n=1 Tax=Streptomyces sp. NPDC005355 TaxID=3157038 RepID=UPI0033AA6722